MKMMNILTGVILLTLFVLAYINMPMTKTYPIHKTRSGDFILVDDAKGGARLYELIELETNHVSEVVK